MLTVLSFLFSARTLHTLARARELSQGLRKRLRCSSARSRAACQELLTGVIQYVVKTLVGVLDWA
jgi:hypothetical protein